MEEEPLLADRDRQAQGGGKYGQERGGGASKEVAERVEALKTTVHELAGLEVEAQHSFFALKERFRKRLVK